MKVAVTAQGEDLTSAVDPRFGRAQYFVVVDTASKQFSAHDNAQNINAAQGAGIQAAANVVKLGVDAVITGNVGPKAFAALQAGNVKMFIGAEGTVAEAIEKLNKGELTETDDANVEGHWI